MAVDGEASRGQVEVVRTNGGVERDGEVERR